MDITPRMKQILQVLLKEEGAISVKNLAEQVGISKRTVQRELEYISQSLKGYEIRFLSKTGVGVWLEGSEQEKARLLFDTSAQDVYDVTNREERRKRLVLELLKEKGFKKLFYYSSQFDVSEATISTDLEAVETWLNRYGLTISRKPGSGIFVEGSEESYRRAIRAFINETLSAGAAQKAFAAYENTVRSGSFEHYTEIKNSGLGKILNDTVMERVIACIAAVEKAQIFTLTENSYIGLIIHISIAINRIMKHEVIETDERWEQFSQDDHDYILAETIAKELEEEFEITIPQVEISYICLHIKGSKHEKIRWEDTPVELEGRGIQRLVNDMIDAFDREKAYLLKQDDEFIQGLLAHLQPTLVRLINGMHIQNPVLLDIQREYPDMYEKCREVAKVLEQCTGKKVPEEEIGFLTVHFGAAMVRLEGWNEKIRQVQAGVVCSSGIGISRLMASRLKKAFKGRMQITSYGKNDITPYIAAKQDFFISSIPMEQTDAPVIFVNPLLNEQDMDKIRRMVYQYERMPKKQEGEDTFAIQLEKINLLAAQIKTVIKYMEFFQVDNQITFEELLLAVAERFSPYLDRQEQIREDIMRRERIASQIFAEFGFALLHTRTKGVIRPGFGVCMTKDLGAFADPYMKEIGVVLIMLIPANKNQQVDSEIMGYISSMLIEDYAFLDTIRRGQKEEIRTALSDNLKKYFNRYISRLS